MELVFRALVYSNSSDSPWNRILVSFNDDDMPANITDLNILYQKGSPLTKQIHRFFSCMFIHLKTTV
jgi:hypothetical protein